MTISKYEFGDNPCKIKGVECRYNAVVESSLHKGDKIEVLERQIEKLKAINKEQKDEIYQGRTESYEQSVMKYEHGAITAFDELKKLIVEFLEEDEYMPYNQRELIEKALDEVGECIYGEFSCRFGQKYSRLTPREE